MVVMGKLEVLKCEMWGVPYKKVKSLMVYLNLSYRFDVVKIDERNHFYLVRNSLFVSNVRMVCMSNIVY